MILSVYRYFYKRGCHMLTVSADFLGPQATEATTEVAMGNISE